MHEDVSASAYKEVKQVASQQSVSQVRKDNFMFPDNLRRISSKSGSPLTLLAEVEFIFIMSVISYWLFFAELHLQILTLMLLI